MSHQKEMNKENRKLRTKFTFLIISFKSLCENKKTTNERKMMKMRKQKKMNNGNRKVRTEFATLIISSKSFCEMIMAEREKKVMKMRQQKNMKSENEFAFIKSSYMSRYVKR